MNNEALLRGMFDAFAGGHAEVPIRRLPDWRDFLREPPLFPKHPIEPIVPP